MLVLQTRWIKLGDSRPGLQLLNSSHWHPSATSGGTSIRRNCLLRCAMVLGHLDLAWNNYSNNGVRTSTMRPMVVATRTLKFVQFRVEHLRFGNCHLHLQRISPIVWPVIMVMAIRPTTEAMCFCHLGMNAFARVRQITRGRDLINFGDYSMQKGDVKYR
eukprot:SAG31_NODE_1361_length_8631_cov_3.401899_7_plen_160_part_00